MNTFQLQYDLTMFYRRLRLREYFYDEESLVNDRDTQHNPFRLRNKRWMPEKNREPALEAYIQAIAENSTKTNIRIRDNLSTNERLALRRLRERIERSEIVIKPADKGSAMVVMSYDDYVKEAERQLGNSNYYQLLIKDPTLCFTTQFFTGNEKSSLN